MLLAMIQSSHAHLPSTKTNDRSDAHLEKFPKKIQSNRQQVKMPGKNMARLTIPECKGTLNNDSQPGKPTALVKIML